MRIYLDLDSRRLLTTPTRPLTSLEFKRRDNDSIELQFLRDAVVQELPAGTTPNLGIKPAGDYDAAFLAYTTLAKSGSGAATVYTGVLNLNTTALAAAFADEPVTVSGMLEVEWVTGDVVSSSKTLPTTIQNDVIRGDEGEPAELPFFYTAATSDFKATQAQAEAGANNATWMTPLRTAQAIAELAATDWDSVSGKPTTFPPFTHTHTASQITDFSTAVAAVSPPVHQHAVSDVNGLQSALDDKQDSGNYALASHQHSAGDITSGTLAIARIPTGTTSTSVALGNHTHGNLTSAGAIGSTSGVPIITGAGGVLQAGSFGTTAGTFAAGNHTHAGMLTASGGITTIAVVSSMPASPDASTLYIVTA